MRIQYYLILFIILVGCNAKKNGGKNDVDNEKYKGPIIDMYIHAENENELPPERMAMCIPLSTIVPYHDPSEEFSNAWNKALTNPDCENPIWSPVSYEEYLERVKTQLDKNNVVAAASGTLETLIQYDSIFDDKIIPSLKFRIGRDSLSVNLLESILSDNKIKLLGEVSNQYNGIAPNDSRMYPYYELAEKLDVAVSIHLGSGAPGSAYLFSPDYLAALSNPLLLEDVLKKYPRLRISVNHYGEPFIDEMITMLYHYPQLYINIAGIQWCYPKEYFYEYHLKKLVDAGFGKRILYGSDTFIWPELIEESISIINNAEFLTYEQKADIFYNNAVRYLRLENK
ncbi:MAG: amidohydrolase family protein [Saprospiraceae bacterium]|nr:amidohydrolase family protein [Saprospiraceae bacterium]